MRLTLRGFQDLFAHLHETYSGTASRLSQRILCSEAACHSDWILVTIDVEKAFLQGMTYQEIQQTTGEPERFVYFILPPGSAALSRKLPGFEGYHERYECLRCLVPGTGTKDAPRAFSLKLAKVTRSPECGFAPTTMDKELECRHESQKLTSLLAKHVTA